jgi:hypothetical protein
MYLETTDVPMERSAAEICSELVKVGARQISTQYSEDGKIIGITWLLIVEKHPVNFALPARIDPVFEILRKNAKLPDKVKLRVKAEKIAWRQLLAWVRIQNAMIQTGMAEPDEVFMPYAVERGTSRTMFQAWKAQLALPPGPSEKPQ